MADFETLDMDRTRILSAVFLILAAICSFIVAVKGYYKDLRVNPTKS